MVAHIQQRQLCIEFQHRLRSTGKYFKEEVDVEISIQRKADVE